jgi:hypothetical protein
MARFQWYCNTDTPPQELLHPLCDQLMLVEEILRKPDAAGHGGEFVLTAGAAAGLSLLVSSIEWALREIASVLDHRPPAASRALVQAFQEYVHAFPATQPYLTKLFTAARRQQFVEWTALHQVLSQILLRR